MLGYTFDELELSVNQWADFIYPDDKDRAWESIKNHLEGNTSFHQLEYRMFTKNGQLKWILDSAKIVKRDETGKPVRMSGTHLDITERKKSEVELHESNATKDKLFSIIAHDLRSPFNSILGFSELLIENVKEFDIVKSEKHLGIINSSAKNTLVLLDNLLNWAKSQTGQLSFMPKKIMLSKVIQEVIESNKLIAIAKNISLNYTLRDELEVYADENILKLVLRNLISNAIKFTKSGGHIDIKAILKQDHIEISVTDNVTV